MRVALQMAAGFIEAAGFHTVQLTGAWPDDARAWLLGNLKAGIRLVRGPGMPLPDITAVWLGTREERDKPLSMQLVDLIQ